ncbi:DUF262 domain-containing HNH endonuclease family protein [Dokdonella sp.]|uniref:DUF262 domain-containing protein n=1 Tax=Dokdonella sp. TaxID=2291710 RepID=UPI0026146142|nr:DUF262 domain-containing HNH endonuclease family protein [Dokdonella sp.]
MKLNPQHMKLAELLPGRLFRIPEYQRPYAWGKAQRADLFKDILDVETSRQDHYMATVVTLKKDLRQIGADEFSEVDIVDGQQRLTTIVILLKAIERELDDTSPETAKVKREISELLVKGNDHSLVLLQTNHDTTTVMSTYLRKGTLPTGHASTQAEQNLLDAVAECRDFVRDWKEERSLIKLVAILRNQLTVIYHELHDEGTVYRVFEVLNSRGLDVKWIDKLKSQLMGRVFMTVDESGRAEAVREMHTHWQAIYRKLGLALNMGDDALRFAGTWVTASTPKRVLKESAAAGVLAKKAGMNLKSIMEVVERLREIVDVLVNLSANPRLKAVTGILHARFVAAAIILRKFPEQDEAALLREWEKVTFRIFSLADEDSRTKVGDYVQLGFDILAKNLSIADIREKVRDLGIGFDMASILKGMDWSESYDGWTESLRYLLFRYEEHLAKKAGGKINTAVWSKIWNEDPARSIEHIQPRASGKRYVNHLGNLTMLSPNVNSSLGAQSPMQKAGRYIDEGVRATSEVGREIQRTGVWNQKQVLERAKKIEEFVAKEWG